MPVEPSGGEAGRVRCLYCGANNFPNSAACWQCSRPLQAMQAAPASGAEPPATGAGLPPLPAAFPLGMTPRPMPAATALAPKAAAALGMLFPYIGLPVGMVFLMLDDPRKTQLGWLLIGWSIAGTVLNSLALAAVLGPILALLRGFAPHPGGAPPSIPGLPEDPGAGLWMLLFLTHHFVLWLTQ